VRQPSDSNTATGARVEIPPLADRDADPDRPATLLQITLWGTLFLALGEFTEFYEAIYHSGVNFASLGYGDIVMSKDWKLLGTPGGGQWRPDGGHERRRADGDAAALDQEAARTPHADRLTARRCRARSA
jgi:hypothetical protein